MSLSTETRSRNGKLFLDGQELNRDITRHVNRVAVIRATKQMREMLDKFADAAGIRAWRQVRFHLYQSRREYRMSASVLLRLGMRTLSLRLRLGDKFVDSLNKGIHLSRYIQLEQIAQSTHARPQHNHTMSQHAF